MTRARLTFLGALAVAGCATSPYQRAGNGDDVAAALSRSRPPEVGARSLAFLVLGGAAGPRLAAYDLSASRVLWTQPADVTVRVVSGASVLVHGSKATPPASPNGQIVGRDLGSGAVLWQHPIASSEELFGYAADGDEIYVVERVASSGGKPVGRLTALDGRTGAHRWEQTLPSARVAAPAARGGLVAVPVESQYVLLYDGATGAPLGQVLSTEEAATFVRALPEGLFYGSRGVFLMGRDTARGSRRSPGYLTAHLPPFVRPTYDYDFYRPEQTEYSAIDRNRVLWRVTLDGGRPQFRDGLAFVHDYRFFFAFEAASGALRWAYASPTDAVASTDTGKVILFATVAGELAALDPLTGARVYEASLPGEVVRGASFDAEGFTPRPAVAQAAHPPEVTATLTGIIADPDQRFPALKLFAVEELGRQSGRTVTTKLLDLLTDQKTAPLAQQKAGEMLIGRRDAGALDLYRAALRAHADYCDKRSPPPVEVLARAIGALGPIGRSVTPDLEAHLALPETPPAAAAEIARALVQTGATDSTGALRDFLTMYRSDPVYDRDPAALIAASEALLRLGGTEDRELLLFVAEEPHTVAGLRTHLTRALNETAASKNP
ncbi:MAG TPA: PQQ-binding-like beta-propeller repeat protein [Polyangia bacterium]|nr:PQQ-binding-like beta-propeller repeat protein [Polyangia bacterium]